jgi:hypothetical protein
MSASIFRITDGTAAGTVDFIGGPLYIVNWAPVIPKYKGGGQYIDPPISPGRRIAFYMRENAVERVDFAQRANDGDSADQQLARLVRLLDRAAAHWATHGREAPIWLEARNPRQTNIRYAKIVSGQLAGHGNQFAMPYLQDEGCVVVEPNLSFLLERRDFTTALPGTTAALPLTGNARTINMLFDHSFERPADPDPIWQNRNSNFTRESVTTPVYHGTSALKLTATSTGGGVAQAITGLEIGSSVTCTVWTKVETGTARLQVYDGTGYTGGSSDTSTSTSWAQLSVNKTVPASGTINFVLELVALNDVAYFDDAVVNLTYGKVATATTDKIYFSNGRGEIPITHIYHYDDSLTTFSSNLVGASKPVAFLPATVQVNDYVAFGASATSVANGGAAFMNILMDISTAADATLEWKYIDNAGAQQDLNVVDNTEDFSVTGENIVQLTRPSTWGPRTLNSVEAWWVLAKVTAVSSTTPPQLDTFDPFPISDNHIEIPSASLTGDNPPTVDLSIVNEGAATIAQIFEFVTTGNDDGFFDTAVGPPTGGDLTGLTEDLAQDSAIAVRFSSMSIPQGAKIVYARFYATSNGGTSGAWNSTLSIENVDDSSSLSASEDIEARNWDPDNRTWIIDPDWWNEYSGYQFAGPRVDSMVQTVVDRSGWADGNAMTFMIKDTVVGATDDRSFEMFETEPFAWRLVIQYVDDKLFSTNIVMGARSVSRGANFRSVVNLTPYQRDAMTIFLDNGTDWSIMFGDGPPHAHEYHPVVSLDAATASSEGGTYLDRTVVTIPPDLSSSFSGGFRVFLRSYNHTAPTAIASPLFRLRTAISGSSFYTQSVSPNALNIPEMLDLGVITIPEYAISDQNTEMLDIELAIQMKSSDATVVSLLDLVLIPVDEWTAEVTAPRSINASHSAGKTVEVKSVNTAGRLKVTMVDDSGRTAVWRPSGSKLSPPLDETTRLYFATRTDQTVAEVGELGSEISNQASWSNLTYSVQAQFVNSYLLYAGAL